jgi:hypothetical protein
MYYNLAQPTPKSFTACLSALDLLGSINPRLQEYLAKKARKNTMDKIKGDLMPEVIFTLSEDTTKVSLAAQLEAPPLKEVVATLDEPTQLTPDNSVTEVITEQAQDQQQISLAATSSPQEQAPILIDSSMKWPEFTLSDPNTKNAIGYLMVPIATLGSWVHPLYGEVLFEQQDFDQIITNFNKKVTGYEPPLFLGHSNDVNVWGDRPAVAFLEALAQQEDVLWGFYSVVDDQVYLDIKKGKYRYSSAEIIRGAKNTVTNEEVGVLLHACALTNTPFLTTMPQIKAFSQPSKTCTEKLMAFAFPLVTDSCTKDLNPSINFQNSDIPTNLKPSMSETPVTTTEQLSVATAEVANSTVLDAKNRALEAELREVKAQLLSMQEENTKYKQAFATQKREQRLSVIKEAKISQSAKQAFSVALNAPGIDDETADKIVDEVVKMSAAEEDIYLNQHGSTVGQEEVIAKQEEATKVDNLKQNFAYQAYLARRERGTSR